MFFTEVRVKKKFRIVDILQLQAVVMIYSINTVVAKLVSGQPFLSMKFILLYGLEFAVLGVYAICWQQMIKKFELSIAYANKAMTLLWSLLWSVLLFGAKITPAQIIGVVLVILGTVIINSEEATETEGEHD